MKAFSHDTDVGLFANTQDALNKNSHNPNAPLFSNLDQLESFRNAEGKFHLKLCYPERQSKLGYCNEWLQSSNPVTDGKITGFKKIHLSFSKNGAGKPFGGLGKSGKSETTLMDDTGSNPYWWMAVGATKYYEKKKIPGPWLLPKVTKVEMFVNAKEKKCPKFNFNTWSRIGQEINKNVNTWQACKELCIKRKNCKNWVWHPEESSNHAFQCMTMTGYRQSSIDWQAVSGDRMTGDSDCGICQDENVNLLNRKGAESTKNVKSWQACSDLCREKKGCKNWVWHREKTYHGLECVTMTGYGKKYNCKDCISGDRNCGSKNEKLVEFQVKSTSDATILLSSCDGCDGYEVVIGGWSNTKSIIREGKQSTKNLKRDIIKVCFDRNH